MDDPELSIIIPCYNEEDNIVLLLDRFYSVFGQCLRPKIELILCDNGSTDNTGNIIDQEIRKYPGNFVKKSRIAVNKGYGFGIFSSFKVARGRLIAFMHSDLQTDPVEIKKAYELYSSEPGIQKIIVKGRRGRRKLSEMFLSWVLGVLTYAILGVYLPDINAQPKLFSKDILGILKNPPHDFTFDLYLLTIGKANGYRILEFGVDSKERLRGESKGGSGSKLTNKLRISKKFLRYLFVLRNSLLKNNIGSKKSRA